MCMFYILKLGTIIILTPQANWPNPSIKEIMAAFPFVNLVTDSWLPSFMGIAVLITL